MRLVFTAAAVTTALAIPGLAGAGDPQLQFEIRPKVPVVIDSGGRRDTLLALDVHNPSDRPTRIEGLRLLYLEGTSVVKTVDDASALFVDAGLLSDPKIDAGEAQSWAGICLAPPTAATDRVRFEMRLVQRRGLHAVRATQALDVPLAAPEVLPSILVPVRGAWRVTQGHACGTSHRMSPLGSEFAWDLAAVDATSSRDVVAPVAGRVAFAVGDVEDNAAGGEIRAKSYSSALRHPLWFFGNYVVIDAGTSFVLLAHLRKGSLAVKAGDTVRAGDVVGYVGNSGNTSAPHLHVQVMNRADPSDPDVAGVPARFRDYVEATARVDGKERESVVRKVAAGDPPEGSVILSVAEAAPSR
ncbi:MAG TPA: M23 family metallopeptidase [Candidatus Polarisedimenticolaceae bacterium]|nr:M23 family metallopeptidase [Candidatus Polarisedimenticolaceae bacterium]